MSVASNITSLGFSAAGVAYGVIAGVTLGSIADQLLGTIVNKLGYSTSPSTDSLGARAKSFLVVMAAGLIGFGSVWLLGLLPFMQLSQAETILSIAAYIATQNVALAAAKGVFSSGEEAYVAGFVGGLF